MPDAPLHLVTIVNYAPDPRIERMTDAFFDSVIAGGAERITVLFEHHEPVIAARHHSRVPIRIVRGRSVDLGLDHFNLRFKLVNLAVIDEPFLFLDADTYVLGDLHELWQRRHAKPWIGIDHQRIPADLRTHREPFLNSGVQLVSDPSFYDLDRILEVQNTVAPLHRAAEFRKEEMFACPGTDQALLYRYFRTIGYDYTHPEIGPEWNSCAGITTVSRAGNRWTARTTGLSPDYDVKLIHYWSQFKPWRIDCPIDRSYGAS